MRYKSEGFKTIKEGAEIGGEIIEDCGSAAKAFAQRLANRYGKRRVAIIKPDGWNANSADYYVTIFAPSGWVDATEYMVVTHERV